MNAIIQNLTTSLIYLIFIALVSIAGILIKNNRQTVKTKILELVQTIEGQIQGTGLGPEKKALLIKQLDAAGITVTTWVDKQIDNIVDYLNTTKGWLVTKATETVTSTTEEAINSVTSANNTES